MGKIKATQEQVKRYKIMYQKGLLTKEQVKALLDKGMITEAQYIEIVGVEN